LISSFSLPDQLRLAIEDRLLSERPEHDEALRSINSRIPCLKKIVNEVIEWFGLGFIARCVNA